MSRAHTISASGALAAVLSLAMACGSSVNRTSEINDTTPAAGSSGSLGGGTPGSSGSLGSSGSPEGGTGSQAGCSDAAKLVYVVSDSNDLYSYAPDTSKFVRIGTLHCPGSATPNSMAVDRTGMAWVNMSDGSLFKVNTADASCTASGFQKNQSGFQRFGMAFASNSAGSQDETLYVVGIDGLSGGKGLATIDLTSLKLTKIGDFSGSLRGKAAELTGTGDGKLYGFFTTEPATLAEIDKTTGATSSVQQLNGVSTGQAWAFSFWGGDFWFYTSPGMQPSTVTRKQSSTDGSLSTAVDDVGGFEIVGAGVSTCAPTSPPPR